MQPQLEFSCNLTNDILDYHRDSNNADGSLIIEDVNSPGVVDGTTDDLKGLINL